MRENSDFETLQKLGLRKNRQAKNATSENQLTEDGVFCLSAYRGLARHAAAQRLVKLVYAVPIGCAKCACP